VNRSSGKAVTAPPRIRNRSIDQLWWAKPAVPCDISQSTQSSDSGASTKVSTHSPSSASTGAIFLRKP